MCRGRGGPAWPGLLPAEFLCTAAGGAAVWMGGLAVDDVNDVAPCGGGRFRDPRGRSWRWGAGNHSRSPLKNKR